MFKIVRPLDWVFDEEDNVTHADPEGMLLSYYISPADLEESQYQLVYIKENGEFEEHSQLFVDLKAAKSFANEHYQKQVALNIIPEYLH